MRFRMLVGLPWGCPDVPGVGCRAPLVCAGVSLNLVRVIVTDLPNFDINVVDVCVAVGFGRAREGSTESVSKGGEAVTFVAPNDGAV